MAFQTVTLIGPYSTGEIPEPILVSYKDATGTAIDLTGFSAAVAIEAIDQTVAGLGAGAVTITDPAAGVVRYVWAAADFTTDGCYRLQLWVGNGTNRYASVPFEYFVTTNTSAPNI